MTWLIAFDSAGALVSAIPRLRESSFIPVQAFTPHVVDGLEEALPPPSSPVTPVMLAGAIVGALAGFGFQVWSAVFDYPINVGGRPLFSWPAFVPTTFETAILVAAVAGFIGMLVVCGLPRLHHPLFDVEGFERASQDRYLLAVRDTRDSADAASSIEEVLRDAPPLSVTPLPDEEVTS